MNTSLLNPRKSIRSLSFRSVIICLVISHLGTARADDHRKYEAALAAVTAMTGDDLMVRSLGPARKAFIIAQSRANHISPEQAAEKWDKIVPGMRQMFAGVLQARARVFEEEFSDDELAEIKTFYNTPTGKKLAAKQPDINRRIGPELGPMMRDLSVIGASSDAVRQTQPDISGQAQ